MEQLHHYLESAESELFQLLERLVLQSSHSLNKEGVDRVGSLIVDALAGTALELTAHTEEQLGNNLVFKSPACQEDQRHILLLGHMDTVFPLASSFNYYREDGRHIYGPGVCDMKGGLVTAVYLLKTLDSAGLLESIPITLICNSDEEIGSPASTELIKGYGRQSICGLVFECGGTGNEVVTARKGKSGYHFDIYGKSGHAAFAEPGGKASAVLELAHKIIAIEKLNDPEKEIVVNVGRVEGGVAANVVAEGATAEIDTRYITNEDGDYLKQRIEAIASQATIDGTIATVTPTNYRLPMTETEENLCLFELFQKQAGRLGMELKNERRSGVSDANTLAECNIPVIDGLGPIGDLDHSPEEYIVKETLLSRCMLATLAVIEIWRQHGEHVR